MLKTGDWTVVLFHHDCPKCKQVIAEFAENQTPNVVCVEVPPVGGASGKEFLYGRVTDKCDWFVSTPVIVAVDNEKVVNVQSGF